MDVRDHRYRQIDGTNHSKTPHRQLVKRFADCWIEL